MPHLQLLQVAFLCSPLLQQLQWRRRRGGNQPWAGARRATPSTQLSHDPGALQPGFNRSLLKLVGHAPSKVRKWEMGPFALACQWLSDFPGKGDAQKVAHSTKEEQRYNSVASAHEEDPLLNCPLLRCRALASSKLNGALRHAANGPHESHD